MRQSRGVLRNRVRARHSTLTGEANLLVMPSIYAANIAYNLLKTTAGKGIAMGPVLLCCAKPVHILTPSATIRHIVNMTALCVVDAVYERWASGLLSMNRFITMRANFQQKLTLWTMLGPVGSCGFACAV